MMIGVSPAFYLSRYGTGFTLPDIIDSMKLLSDWRFDCIQLEIFHDFQLSEWKGKNCRLLNTASCDLGVSFSQFVAHFLLSAFKTPEALKLERGRDELRRVLGFLSEYELVDTVTIPLPEFQGNRDDRTILGMFDEKMTLFLDDAEEAGISLAFEPQPGSLGEDLSFLKRFPRSRLNFDPGHLLCSGWDPADVDTWILQKVMATHLCENDGMENLSLRPGRLYCHWEKTLRGLLDAGYEGSLDLEIICLSDQVEDEYKKGQKFLLENVYKIIYAN